MAPASCAACRRHPLLLAGWFACFLLGAAAAGVFAHGLWRDLRIGEPVLGLDFGVATPGWVETRFRVWDDARFKLFFSSVNHDEARVGAPLAAAFEVSIEGPHGRIFERAYAPLATGHTLPFNYTDTELGHVELKGAGFNTWALRARVLAPDPRYVGVRSELKLWSDRADPGMGGLINYVMILPAAFFMLLAAAFAVALAGRKIYAPLWLTAAVALPLLVLVPL